MTATKPEPHDGRNYSFESIIVRDTELHQIARAAENMMALLEQDQERGLPHDPQRFERAFIARERALGTDKKEEDAA